MSAFLDVRLNLVTSWEEAQQFWNWFQQPHDWLGIDTETGGFDWWTDDLRLVQIGDCDAGWAIPWEGWGGIAKEAIEGYRGPMVMHNSKFDLHFLEYHGVKFPRHLLHDSMAMVAVLEPLLSKSLKSSSERHVFKGASAGEKLLQSVMDKNKWTWATIPIEVPEYWSYAALDPVLAARLARKLYPKVQASPAFQAYQYEVAVAQVLKDMERAGLLLDNDHIIATSAKLDEQEQILRSWFQNKLKITNPFSDRQLISLFQNHGYVFNKTTDKGNLSLDSDVLEDIVLDRPDLAEVSKAVSRIRDYHKNKTYFDNFLELQDSSQRLHTSINPLGARTGRMSSARPNLQNVPARTNGKMVRSSFVASPGYKLISADFDQIEYRIMVSRAGEERLIKAIQDGYDLHTYMTAVVYRKPMSEVMPAERRLMKNATFAFLYGAGDVKFAGMAGIPVEHAREFRTLYAQEFPAIDEYAKNITVLGKTGQAVHTLYLGRPQQVDNQDEGYKLLNYVTQGEAGDVLKKKLVELSMTDVGPYLRLPIHDEILFEVPEEETVQALQIIHDVMPEMTYFRVPLTVGSDVIDSWGDKY